MTKMRYPKFEVGQMYLYEDLTSREYPENPDGTINIRNPILGVYKRYMYILSHDRQLWLCTFTRNDTGETKLRHFGMTWRSTRQSLMMEMPNDMRLLTDEEKEATIAELKELFAKVMEEGMPSWGN